MTYRDVEKVRGFQGPQNFTLVGKTRNRNFCEGRGSRGSMSPLGTLAVGAAGGSHHSLLSTPSAYNMSYTDNK